MANANANANTDQALKDLVEVLQKDLEVRTAQLQQMNDLLESRNQLIQEDVDKKTQAPKWWAGLAGLGAVIIGLWVASLIISMVGDMRDMSDNMAHMKTFMQNMGEGQRAPGEQSYMASMAKNMGQMSGDMNTMKSAMTIMQGDMSQMNVSMADMTGSMGTMTGDMSAMNDKVGDMTQSVGNMSGSVGRMNVDTNLMRNGVQRMARDTGYMGQPFRAMDSVMPW